MGFISENSPLDRSLALVQNMHPNLAGDMILTPDDLLRGAGDFVRVDSDGSPEGWTLGKPENPDGRHVYVGLTPDACTRQTLRPIAHDQPTHLVNYELVEGAPAPDPTTPLLAEIPTPLAPRLGAVDATREGYPGSNPLTPYWYAWAFVDRYGNLTKASDPVFFHLQNGQSVRVPLPPEDAVPDGIHLVALLLSEPNRSRTYRPGPMRVQRVIDLRLYELPTYDLTGPYRNRGDLAPQANQTKIYATRAPGIERTSRPAGARVGEFVARIRWTDRWGQTMPGSVSRTVTIPLDERYTVRDKDGGVEFLAGRGSIRITRPEAPEGATGWRVDVYAKPTHVDAGYEAGWRRVEHKLLGYGGATPFPLGIRTIETAGWSGSEKYYAANDACVLVDGTQDEARENTTGFPNPEGVPETPEAFGNSRPDADRYYVRVTDTVRGVESLPSAAATVEIADDQIIRVRFLNHHNRVTNPIFVEQDPDGLPVGWKVAQNSGSAKVEGQELVLSTPDVLASGTATAETDNSPVDPSVETRIESEFEVLAPEQGAFAGSLEVVLRQYDASGASSAPDAVIAAIAEIGEQIVEATIGAVGSNAATSLVAQTTDVAILYRYAGASRNHQARLRYTGVRQQDHKPRRPRRRKRPPQSRPGRPIAGSAPERTVVSDPPEPVRTPQARPVPEPDRPRSTGAVEASVNFDAGVPADYAVVQTGAATVTTDAAAAIGGSAQGLKLAKASGTALSGAYVEKTYAHPLGLARRMGMGAFLRNRFPTLPTSRLRLHELSRPADKRAIAWMEVGAAQEVVDLTLKESPETGGNVAISLADAPAQLVPISSVKEVASLSVNAAPTAVGSVAVYLNGVRYNVPAGGNQQTFTIAVGNVPSTPGMITVTVNGVARAIRVTPTLRRRRGARVVAVANTPGLIAQDIADAGWSGYDVTRSGRVVTFVAKRPGPRPAPTFNPGATRLVATVAVQQPGTSETADELASRIRGRAYPGWTTAPGATPNVVTFTAVAGGPRTDAAYSANTTGATGVMSTTTHGSVEDADALAAKIRATAFAGWTVSGSGRVARFTSTSAGIRQASTYSARGTGADGYFRTIQQGSNADLTAHAQDDAGNVDVRKIERTIPAGAVFDTDLTVSGAGTDRAVVSVWGTVGGAGMELLARFEDVDLTNSPAGTLRIGVVSEDKASATWEIHVDEVLVTERGRTFHRDHNALGEWLPQIEAYYHRTQPVRQDLLLQDGWAAVVPGATYVLSAWIRASVAASVPARPLVAYARNPVTGRVTMLGDVTNSQGLTGISGWTEHKIVLRIPAGCREIYLSSRDIGAGAFVIQEVVLSPGSVPKRTYRYQTAGSYETTFDLRTPDAEPSLAFWGFKRISLGAVVDSPSATETITKSFASADPDPQNPRVAGPFSAASSDPTTVPDRAFVRSTFSASGSGWDTPALKTGSPNAEYVAMLSSTKRMSVFLKGDRTELPGGTAFRSLKGISKRPPDGRRVLPNGRLFDDPQLFGRVGYLPECELLVFSEEAREYVENNWKELFAVELYGRQAATILLSEQPEFRRETITVIEGDETRPDLKPGSRHAIWAAKLAPSEVVSVIGIAG